MKFTLGFSPCPNDTFIFDALVNQKIDTEGVEFDVVLEDVQTLNEWALAGKLDISKISYGVLPLITDRYLVLNSGGALGKGVGPLLITNRTEDQQEEQVNNSIIAIPGQSTTAHLLFSLAYPNAHKKEFMIFSQIEDAVSNGHTDMGVIIHENRFTYQQKGLKKIIDLGDYWENKTGLPIPLGGIVARRTIAGDLLEKIDRLIEKSVAYAFSKYPEISSYVECHAQEMDQTVMKQHIDLYVNEFSRSLGNEGKNAVELFLQNHPAYAPTMKQHWFRDPIEQ